MKRICSCHYVTLVLCWQVFKLKEDFQSFWIWEMGCLRSDTTKLCISFHHGWHMSRHWHAWLGRITRAMHLQRVHTANTWPVTSVWGCRGHHCFLEYLRARAWLEIGSRARISLLTLEQSYFCCEFDISTTDNQGKCAQQHNTMTDWKLSKRLRVRVPILTRTDWLNTHNSSLACSL